MGWPEAYLPDVNRQRLDEWLAACGVSKEVEGWLLERAADCRLAFSRLGPNAEVANQPGASVPVESIISQTRSAPTGGRPTTTRWAFWTAYSVRDSGLLLPQGRLKSGQLAALVHILTGRQITPAELRAEFGRLRREANVRASQAAKALLDRPVRAELGDQDFFAYFQELSDDLSAGAQMPPMIVNGRLNQEWLERLVSLRRAILRDVNKLGVLTGEPPMLRLLRISQLYRGLPLGPPPPLTVHLGKALDVQSPTVAAPTTVSVSLNLSTPPYGVALCALPRWWGAWEAALHLPMGWRATGVQNPHPECQP